MVVAHLKPEDEIYACLGEAKSILLLGCGGCTSVCYAGGLRETEELAAGIRRRAKSEGRSVTVKTLVIEMQCEIEYFDAVREDLENIDAVLSLGCGAGVQLLAEEFSPLPVYPALNTLFVGASREPGIFVETCRTCGDCQLAYTGGICPVTRCPKGIFNGPCGGSENERCEVHPQEPCAWCEIYNRLKEQGRVESILEVREPVLWQNQKQGSIDAWEKQ